MKKITNRDLQMLYAPAPQSLAADVRRVLCSLNDETEEKNVKKKLPFALLIAAALILICLTALAVGGSRLLTYLFPDGNVPEATASLLDDDIRSASESGVTFSVTESLFDGSTLLIQAEVQNDTDETLYAAVRCANVNRLPASGSPAEIFSLGGSGNILFDYGVFFTRVRPGEKISGNVERLYDAEELENAESLEVVLEAHIVRAVESVAPFSGDLFSYEDLTGYAGEEVARIPLTFTVSTDVTDNPSFHAEVDGFRFADYTLRITEMKFAPASASITFAVIPDDPADVALEISGGEAVRGRLVRDYALLDEALKPLNFGMEGWDEDGVLYYLCKSSPFAVPPRVIYIVPLADGEPIMEEAAAVTVVSD